MTKLERLILTSKPISFISYKSRQIILPGFAGVPLYDVFRFFLKQIKRVGLTDRASAIAYNFLMAIPAVLICLCTIIPWLPISKQFTRELLRLTRTITPNRDIYIYMKQFIDDFINTPRVGLLSFGFLIFIFYASNAMMGVLRTFDKSIYQHDRKENFIKKRWKAIKMTIIMFGLVIGVILLLIGQGFVFKTLMGWFNISGSGITWIRILRWIITVGLFFYSTSYIYMYGTAVKKRWHTFSPGSILATTLTILTTWFFSFWVTNFSSYNKIYGSLGTLLVLMLLIYLNSLILLIGFELNVSITYLRAEAEERQARELKGLVQQTTTEFSTSKK